MSPATPTPGINPIPTATPKGPAAVSVPGVAAMSAAGTAGSAAATTDGPTVTVPSLNAGKLVPGSEEWRALERRASSVRI